jgi:hypothetical protein
MAVSSLMRRPRFTPGKFLVLFSIKGSVNPRVIVQQQALDIFKKKCNDLIGIQTLDLPAFSIVS